MNTGKQEMFMCNERLKILFFLCYHGEPQQYPSEPDMTLRRGDQASLSLSMISVGGCHMGKGFMVK